MNMEQRTRLYDKIQRMEGLLAYAVAHGEMEETERIHAELVKMVEAL